MGIWGHGLRERQQRGPLEPGGEPATVVVRVRRYLCRRCESVILVVPRGMLAWKHFSASAIGYAIALWGLGHRSAPEVRRQTSKERVGNEDRWATLRRWVKEIRDRVLFGRLRRVPTSWSLRQIAARAAAGLAAEASPSLRTARLEVQAFVGALRLA